MEFDYSMEYIEVQTFYSKKNVFIMNNIYKRFKHPFLVILITLCYSSVSIGQDCFFDINGTNTGGTLVISIIANDNTTFTTEDSDAFFIDGNDIFTTLPTDEIIEPNPGNLTVNGTGNVDLMVYVSQTVGFQLDSPVTGNMTGTGAAILNLGTNNGELVPNGTVIPVYHGSFANEVCQVTLFVPSLGTPVEWSVFTANHKGNANSLYWKTESEVVNSHFEVMHSNNGKDWEQIGRVEGHGTTSESKEYNFEHRDYTTGTNYYKLKQVDFNGDFEYSKIRTVQIQAKTSSSKIFPNPISLSGNSRLQLSTSNNDVEKLISVFDLNGKLVYKKKTVPESGLDLQSMLFQSGIYTVHIESNGVSEISRLTVID